MHILDRGQNWVLCTSLSSPDDKEVLVHSKGWFVSYILISFSNFDIFIHNVNSFTLEDL